MDHNQIYGVNGPNLNHFQSAFHGGGYRIPSSLSRPGVFDAHSYDPRTIGCPSYPYEYGPSSYTQIWNVASYHSNYLLPETKSDEIVQPEAKNGHLSSLHDRNKSSDTGNIGHNYTGFYGEFGNPRSKSTKFSTSTKDGYFQENETGQSLHSPTFENDIETDTKYGLSDDGDNTLDGNLYFHIVFCLCMK
ncbi:hypothetical protein DPMN_076928 [Dreissena polymorpha]|uniref:Uncharacterized protein n=1 Tax=Dreissena polymorpha TaxID=45954 RepID=A0A9D3YL03_DREPO|nr:hypothetical protein DPMN_076928 [Dreissena polymorpha]